MTQPRSSDFWRMRYEDLETTRAMCCYRTERWAAAWKACARRLRAMTVADGAYLARMRDVYEARLSEAARELKARADERDALRVDLAAALARAAECKP